MYKLIFLLIPLVLFACSKNPVDTGKATGKLDIVATRAEKSSVKTVTASAYAYITNKATSTTVTYPLLENGGSQNFDSNFIDVDYGTYDITVTGYTGLDGAGTVTASGTEYNVVVDKAVVQVNIKLK